MEIKYKAPIDTTEFKKYWNLFIDDVVERDNFKKGHLEQLRVLCQLYTEFDQLTSQIQEQGFTYETDPNGESRYGNQIKVNPSCQLRDKVLVEIRNFSKLLKVVLIDDKKNTKEQELEDDWV